MWIRYMGKTETFPVSPKTAIWGQWRENDNFHTQVYALPFPFYLQFSMENIDPYN